MKFMNVTRRFNAAVMSRANAAQQALVKTHAGDSNIITTIGLIVVGVFLLMIMQPAMGKMLTDLMTTASTNITAMFSALG